MNILFCFDTWCIYRRLSGISLYLGAKNVVSRRANKEGRISPRGWRRSYFSTRMKNVESRSANAERYISPNTGHVVAVRAPRYDLLHPRGEIGRSSSAWRDTIFFIRAVRYNLLHPRAEIRRSLSACRNTTSFRSAVDISTPRTKKSTTQAGTNPSTTRSARTKKSTTQSLFTSESCLSALVFVQLREQCFFFVRGVDINVIKYLSIKLNI